MHGGMVGPWDPGDIHPMIGWCVHHLEPIAGPVAPRPAFKNSQNELTAKTAGIGR
jgi:hypothetical protein